MASICMTVGLVAPTSVNEETTSSRRDSSEKSRTNLSPPAGLSVANAGCWGEGDR